MFRKYVIITLAALFFIGSTGCTSKKAQDDSADVEAGLDDESLESADATENNEDLEAGGDTEVADSGGGEELSPDEQLPDDSGMEIAENADEISPSDLAETTPEESAPADSLAESEAPAADMGGDEVPPPTDYAAAEPTPEPTSEPTTDSTADYAASTPEPSYDEAPKPSMSLKKIASQPYNHGKILVNAVYLAREGDSVESISQKVYASADRVKEICKINSYNCSRPVKVGDKFYYNSPQRPNDDTVIKTFYEDAGVQPQMYMAKQGDNIRKLGKELLGHERSWMELWATNDVESKGDLDEGTSLRYWPSTDAPAAPALADAGAPPPAEAPPMETPPQDMGDQAAMNPPMDQAAPPPPPDDLAMNAPPSDMGQDQLPPPPDPNMAGSMEPPPPPPPPPPPSDMAQAGGDGMEAADPNQQNFMLGVGAVLLLAAAALFISIRKKRARRQIDFNTTTQTQIE